MVLAPDCVDRLPVLPAASDQVTDRSALMASGAPAFATNDEGVRTGALALLLDDATPVPEMLMVCGEPLALSASERAAVSAAAIEGVNVTVMMQLAPAATD